MADEPAVVETPAPEGETDVEKQAFLERLNKESGKRKEAQERASKLEQQVAEMRAQLEQHEQLGLPEIDRMKNELEKTAKRAEEAEKRAQEFEQQATNTRKERWITAAANTHNFVDPDDAVRYVDLADIESSDDAERAVKRVAKQKEHLIKQDSAPLPGRVLENGRTVTPTPGGINLTEEAQIVSDELKKFLKSRS
jgi:DNA repair exonuclease SbcCD ATPase subunit